MNKSSIDYEKKQFESELLREMGALTKLPQQIVLRVAREYAEDILAMYNGECSGKQAAKLVFELVDTVKEREHYSMSASAGWR